MKPYHDDGQASIYHGDARDLSGLSADVIVTDPPYGLAFMGRAWDRVDQQFHQAWAEAALQALPPGGWLLAFGGTRTWHRLACGIEDAGFEVRDTLMWLYGSGFPKGKACLKPGWEPILLARKPGSNVLQIDACRIGMSEEDRERLAAWHARYGGREYAESGVASGTGLGAIQPPHPSGRWPANVVLTHAEGCQPVGTRKVRTENPSRGTRSNDREVYGEFAGQSEKTHYTSPGGTETVEAWDCQPDCPVALLDQQSGAVGGHGDGARSDYASGDAYGWGHTTRARASKLDAAGGASRFFYTAKAGRNERVTVDGEQHPTVKPLSLMRWLVRLVTPPGGTVLDPFCGSGSTLVAARMEGFRAIGIEADARWCEGSAMRLREHEQGQGVLDLSG